MTTKNISKRKPKPKAKRRTRTPKRLYHATDGTGAVTDIKATDMDDALTQAFKLTRAVVKVEAVK